MANRKPARPGDLILDRYMPDATVEEREAARANLNSFLATLVRIEERRMFEDSGQPVSPKQDVRDRVQRGANSPTL